MDKGLIIILEEIQRKVEKINSYKDKKDKYAKNINFLIKEYKHTDIPEEHMPTYDSLLKKGRELIKDVNIKDSKKLEYYLRYCNAALYDFKDNIKPLNKLVLCYIVTCILFLALSPQYFSFILPLILLIPIYLGLKGLKKRSINGLYYSLSVIPMAILTSIAWLKNAFLASKDFNAFIESLASQYGRMPNEARNMIILFVALSVVMLLSSIFTISMGIKYRRMFV